MEESTRKTTALLLAGIACALCALFLFAWLATEVTEGSTAAFDAWGRALVHSYARPSFTATMRFVSLSGSPAVLVPLGAAICALLFRAGRRKAAWLFIACATGGFVLDLSLKAAFGRARPEPFFGTALPLTHSFPSGHALFAVSFYGVLTVLAAKRAGARPLRFVILAMGAVLALLIGLSRIYLGVHYPSDVLGGYLAALVWVAFVGYADRWLRNRRGRRTAPSDSRLRIGFPVI